MLVLNACRDSADNTPAPTNRSTPSYCANLQAPRDPRLQLRTAALVEPTHHVSIHRENPPASSSPVIQSCLSSSPPPRNKLCSLTLTHAALLCSPHQIWSPPSYATAQMLHELPAVTTRTRHLSARSKLKCNSHFTIIIMRHSLMFLQRLLLFLLFSLLFICQPVITVLFYFLSIVQFEFLYFFIFFYFFFPRLSLELQKGLSTNRRCRSVAPVFMLCWCVCSPPAAAAAAQFAGKYWTSSSSKTID